MSAWSQHRQLTNVLPCFACPSIKDTFPNTQGWLTNMAPQQLTALSLTPQRACGRACPREAHHSPFARENTRQHRSTGLRGHLTQRSHQRKARKCETRGTQYTMKGHLLTKADGGRVQPGNSTSSALWGCPRTATRAPQVLTGGST